MEVRIGIQENPRELIFETTEDPAAIEKRVSESIASGSGVLKFVEERGRIILVSSQAIAYIEIGADQVRRVGFIA